jgi:hypothetical protein
MPLTPDNLDTLLLEMRWRVLSLAADLDRLQRCGVKSHPRLSALISAIQILQTDSLGRAEQVELIFSDKTAPPRSISRHS